MNLHLAGISSQVTPGAPVVLTLDGAGWHQSGGKLRVPHTISRLPLPRYAADLNPLENIGQCPRQNYLANRVFDTYDAIVDACRTMRNHLAADPPRIRAIATRSWAQAVSALGGWTHTSTPQWEAQFRTAPELRQPELLRGPSPSARRTRLTGPAWYGGMIG